MSISANDLSQEDSASDSDANSDVTLDEYQPISATEDEFDVSSNDTESCGITDSHLFSSPLENGISILNLDNGDGSESLDDSDEERIMGASDSEISRSFQEDESRRNAPLDPENAMRVMDAMREISFLGFRPDWADRVPEDRWIEQLRRLREPTARN